MTWWRTYGTEAMPIRQSALNSVASQNGCAKRFFYETEAELAGAHREQRTHWKPTLGTAVHSVIERALTNPTARDAILAGRLPSATKVLDAVVEELERAAGGQAIEWMDANPGNERAAAMHMILGALRTTAERARRIVACEAPFVAELGGYHLTGTIDLIFEPRDARAPGEVAFADWKTGERKLAQVVIDHGYQVAMYSHAIAAGTFWPGTERETRIGVAPSAAYIAHLRDFVPYVRGPKTGKLRGPGWYPARRSPDDVTRLAVSLRTIVGTIRMGRRLEQIGEQCGRCPFRGPCFGEGSGPSAQEQRQVELALAGLDVSDVLPDVA